MLRARRPSLLAGALAAALALSVAIAPGASAAGEGAIAGQVLDARTGAPVAEACATATVQGVVWGYDDLVDVATARTGADGRFRIADLAPRTDYRVVFTDCSDRFYRYGTQTWNGRTGRRYDGDPVAVTTGGTTTVDARMAQAGVLQPMVRDAAGNPLPDAYVEVEPVGHDLPPEQPTVRTTNADGQTQPMALTPGLYRLSVRDQRQGLLQEWFDERYWREDGDLIRITSAQDVRPQFRLAPGSFIDGVVTEAATGRPVFRDVVLVRRADDPERDIAQAQIVDGAFRVGPLPAGSYKLFTAAYGIVSSGPDGSVTGGPGHLRTWFGGTTFESATTFTITPDRPASGVRASVQPSAAIGGFVRDATGQGLDDVCVTAFDDAGVVVSSTQTFGGGGGYELRRLPAGSYRVRFEDCAWYESQRAQPLAHRWSGDVRSFSAAAPVTARAGERTPLDARLTEPGGAIAGTVTGLPASGQPGRDAACVHARPADDDREPALAPRPARPAYEVRGLAAGAWRLAVAECRTDTGVFAEDADHPDIDAATAWYGGTGPATATPVTVAAGARRTGIDIATFDRVSRRAGETRIETAAAVSAASFGTAARVVLARSDDYADGLTGGPLAGSQDAPLLLTGRDALAPATAAEIRRLQARTVTILGGTSAVSDRVADEVRALGVQVERVAGTDRYDTARLVATRLGGARAYVVEGRNADPARGWPDAVAVSARAARESTPILLVERDSLPAATRQGLAGRTSATVVGGTAAVSEGVESAVRSEVGTVERVAGTDRYDTSSKVTQGEQSLVVRRNPWLATGRNWPDALTAGPAAAHVGAPFLLVDPRMPTAPTLAWLDGVGRLDGATLVGDQGALSPAVEAAARRRLDVDPPWPGVTR